MDHSLPGGFATISVESLVILDFSSLSNFAMVIALDRGPHGGYTTILVESLVALGITPLELRFGFPDRSLLGGCATISVESLVTVGITPHELRQHQSHNPKHDDPSWGISNQSHWTFH